MEQITKKEFKRMHSSGELLLVTATSSDVEKIRSRVNHLISEGHDIRADGREVTRSSVDGSDVTVYQDKKTGVIYAHTMYRPQWSVDEYLHNTTVYIPKEGK